MVRSAHGSLRPIFSLDDWPVILASRVAWRLSPMLISIAVIDDQQTPEHHYVYFLY
jgi:hypothetical protein